MYKCDLEKHTVKLKIYYEDENIVFTIKEINKEYKMIYNVIIKLWLVNL